MNSDIDKDGIFDATESAIELESGNINPTTKFDYYKGAARPALKYCSISVLVYFALTNVPQWKWDSFLTFLAALFIARGVEKGWDMHTARRKVD